MQGSVAVLILQVKGNTFLFEQVPSHALILYSKLGKGYSTLWWRAVRPLWSWKLRVAGFIYNTFYTIETFPLLAELWIGLRFG